MILQKGILVIISIFWIFRASASYSEISKEDASVKTPSNPAPSSIAIEFLNILDPADKIKNEEAPVKKIVPEKRSSLNDSIAILKLLKEAKPIAHSDYRKAFKLTNKAMQIAEATEDKELMGRVQNSMGNLYWFSGDYTHASEYYIHALKNFQKTNNLDQIAECYRNIGWIYLGQGKYDLSEEYLLKSLRLNKKLDDKERIIMNYDDLGNLYLTSKQYKKGLELCKRSLKLAEKYGFESAVGTIHITTGQLEYKLGRLPEAEKNYETGISILSGNSSQSYNLCLGYLGLGKVKKEQNKPDEALHLFEKAIFIAQKANFPSELAEGYYLASKIYGARNQIEKAYRYMELYAEANDSVNAMNNRNYIQEMGAKLEYEQNKLRIRSLEQEQKLLDTKLERERNFMIFLITLILFLCLGSLIYRSILRRKKDNQPIAKAYRNQTLIS